MFFDSLRGLAWPSRRRVLGTLPGSHRSRLRGAAPELSEYRLYRQGDDPRQLDWKLLARSDRAWIRLAEDRSLLATWFVLDASASMAWPEGEHGKWAVACAVTLGLASVALGSGDPVGLVVSHPKGPPRQVPRSRRGTLQALASVLEQVQPAGSAPLASSLADARPGVRVVIVSDFLGDEEAARIAARALGAAHCDVHAVHVVADGELSPPGPMRAFDPEDARIVRPFDESVRPAYTARFAAWREAVAAAWREAGATWTTVRTSDDPAMAVRRVVSASRGEVAGVTPP